MLKPEHESQGFKPPPRGVADVSVSENHVRSLLLHKGILSLETLENSSKVHLCIIIMAQKSMKDSQVLKTSFLEQRHTLS